MNAAPCNGVLLLAVPGANRACIMTICECAWYHAFAIQVPPMGQVALQPCLPAAMQHGTPLQCLWKGV